MQRPTDNKWNPGINTQGKRAGKAIKAYTFDEWERYRNEKPQYSARVEYGQGILSEGVGSKGIGTMKIDRPSIQVSSSFVEQQTDFQGHGVPNYNRPVDIIRNDEVERQT